jgi:hypothetical protein
MSNNHHQIWEWSIPENTPTNTKIAKILRDSSDTQLYTFFIVTRHTTKLGIGWA